MTTVWSAWEHDTPDVEQTGTDWTHANALDWLPDAGRVLLGLRNLSAIVEIDPQSHQPTWQVGGERSLFELGEGAHFVEQHQFQRLGEERLLVFDNGVVWRVEAPLGTAFGYIEIVAAPGS